MQPVPAGKRKQKKHVCVKIDGGVIFEKGEVFCTPTAHLQLRVGAFTL